MIFFSPLFPLRIYLTKAAESTNTSKMLLDLGSGFPLCNPAVFVFVPKCTADPLQDSLMP